MIDKIQLKTENELEIPKLFAITIHNDDYTTMDFVVEVIMKIFHKSIPEATIIMLEVHEKGSCTVGVFTYDIAVTKKAQIDFMAQEKEFPLKVSIEEV